MLLLAAVFCVVVASGTTETIIYKKLGDDVDLKPEVPSGDKISSISWKVGPDIAVQWYGTDVDYFQFKDRGHLDNVTGVMTIRGLEKTDSNIYTVEINNLKATPIRLIVISEVPVPTVMKKCSEDLKECTLTCEGNISEATPVTYTWRSDDKEEPGGSERTFTITEKRNATAAFTCEMKNPVSQKSSESFSNPFSSSPTGPQENQKIVTGVIVFFCLLIVALLPVVFHRIRTGVCFYEKMSMPWEKDFWTKEQADTVDSNGTAARSPSERSDEESPMTGS